MNIVLKTFFGLEPALVDELVELGYKDAVQMNRAVKIQGEWKDVYFLNLHCRCAISVLLELHTFTIQEEKDLYKEAMKIDWTELFNVNKTFAVRGAVNSTIFNHSQFPFLLVKDAIVDTFRDKTGERPDINTKSPHLVIDLYIREKEGVISLNTSGLPLFQRGYRQSTGEAPLNEVVAAALIRMSGWDRKTPFIDPCCGSGTLVIEAALLACNIPSVFERHHFSFKNLKNYDEALWEDLLSKVNKYVKELPAPIYGSDISSEMVLKAKRNASVFSFGRLIQFSNESLEELNYPEGPATLITNPPYGERISADLEELYGNLGTTFKHRLQGYSCCVISSSEEGFHAIALKPDRKWKLFNGDLECSFRKYSIYAGSKKVTTDEAVKID
jgi:putative N6-adenine-specific DNA methylase